MHCRLLLLLSPTHANRHPIVLSLGVYRRNHAVKRPSNYKQIAVYSSYLRDT